MIVVLRDRPLPLSLSYVFGMLNDGVFIGAPSLSILSLMGCLKTGGMSVHSLGNSMVDEICHTFTTDLLSTPIAHAWNFSLRIFYKIYFCQNVLLWKMRTRKNKPPTSRTVQHETITKYPIMAFYYFNLFSLFYVNVIRRKVLIYLFLFLSSAPVIRDYIFLFFPHSSVLTVSFCLSL